MSYNYIRYEILMAFEIVKGLYCLLSLQHGLTQSGKRPQSLHLLHIFLARLGIQAQLDTSQLYPYIIVLSQEIHLVFWISAQIIGQIKKLPGK